MENKFIKESAAELLEKLGKSGAEKEKEILPDFFIFSEEIFLMPFTPEVRT